MALIKAPEQKKVQLQEKKVVLDASTWRELNQIFIHISFIVMEFGVKQYVESLIFEGRGETNRYRELFLFPTYHKRQLF